MKKIITIINAQKFEVENDELTSNKHLKIGGDDDMSVHDGYHTFEELYEHRIVLWIAFCKLVNLHYELATKTWKSLKHSDNTMFPGWFILGITQKTLGQITYHLPVSKWDECYFAETLDKAPEYDGHTSQDVLERLKRF